MTLDVEMITYLTQIFKYVKLCGPLIAEWGNSHRVKEEELIFQMFQMRDHNKL